MWFKVLGLLIAIALISKATVALAAPGRFYAVRQRQYAYASLPPELLVAPAFVILTTSVAWYATLFHYRPLGWLITGSLTLLSGMSIHHLLWWKRHREAMLKVVSSPRVWQFDCLLLALGCGFMALALLVY